MRVLLLVQPQGSDAQEDSADTQQNVFALLIVISRPSDHDHSEVERGDEVVPRTCIYLCAKHISIVALSLLRHKTIQAVSSTPLVHCQHRLHEEEPCARGTTVLVVVDSETYATVASHVVKRAHTHGSHACTDAYVELQSRRWRCYCSEIVRPSRQQTPMHSLSLILKAEVAY